MREIRGILKEANGGAASAPVSIVPPQGISGSSGDSGSMSAVVVESAGLKAQKPVVPSPGGSSTSSDPADARAGRVGTPSFISRIADRSFPGSPSSTLRTTGTSAKRGRVFPNALTGLSATSWIRPGEGGWKIGDGASPVAAPPSRLPLNEPRIVETPVAQSTADGSVSTVPVVTDAVRQILELEARLKSDKTYDELAAAVAAFNPPEDESGPRRRRVGLLMSLTLMQRQANDALDELLERLVSLTEEEIADRIRRIDQVKNAEKFASIVARQAEVRGLLETRRKLSDFLGRVAEDMSKEARAELLRQVQEITIPGATTRYGKILLRQKERLMSRLRGDQPDDAAETVEDADERISNIKKRLEDGDDPDVLEDVLEAAHVEGKAVDRLSASIEKKRHNLAQFLELSIMFVGEKDKARAERKGQRQSIYDSLKAQESLIGDTTKSWDEIRDAVDRIKIPMGKYFEDLEGFKKRISAQIGTAPTTSEPAAEVARPAAADAPRLAMLAGIRGMGESSDRPVLKARGKAKGAAPGGSKVVKGGISKGVFLDELKTIGGSGLRKARPQKKAAAAAQPSELEKRLQRIRGFTADEDSSDDDSSGVFPDDPPSVRMPVQAPPPAPKPASDSPLDRARRRLTGYRKSINQAVTNLEKLRQVIESGFPDSEELNELKTEVLREIQVEKSRRETASARNTAGSMLYKPRKLPV